MAKKTKGQILPLGKFQLPMKKTIKYGFPETFGFHIH